MAENFEFPFAATPVQIDGGMFARTLDTDQQPNHVLHSAQANSIYARWYLQGQMPPLLAGQWRVQAAFTEIGAANSFMVQAPDAPPAYPVQYQPAAGTPWTGAWSFTIPLAAASIAPGVYNVVILLTHESPPGTASGMAAFYEIPMVRFL